MRPAPGRRSVCAIALLTAVLAVSSDGRALGSVSAVPSQVAAAVYVQEWGQILWGLVTSQTGTQPSSFGEPVVNPDGSFTATFTAPDGTEAILTTFLDSSARMDVFMPDGTTQTISLSTPSFDGVSKTTTDYSVTSSNGLSVNYTAVVDDRGTPIDFSDDTTQLLGSSILPGGSRQTFSTLTAGGQTDVLSAQSDGSTFTMSVAESTLGLGPDFSQAASGTYSDPSFAVNFALISTPKNPSRWAAFLCDLGEGMTGTFALNGDFSGFGQVEESGATGGTLTALVSWTRDGDIQAYSLSGEGLHMGPSAAALDFLKHRWETLTALMGPAPGMGTAVVRPHRAPVVPRLRAARPRVLRTLRGTLRLPLQSEARHSSWRLPRRR